MVNLEKISVIIPTLEPTTDFIQYINKLLEVGITDIIVVNDGSGEDFQTIFDAIEAIQGCTVITHNRNMGKGVALKCAYHYVIENRPNSIGVVTVDSDGQHAIKDVYRIACCVLENHEQIVLGCRNFNQSGIPFKSRVGNKIASGALFLSQGKWLSDTQTGLRGFGASLFPFMIAVEGERFEYEMNVLSCAMTQKVSINTVEIETIYERNNDKTHFHAIKDSLKVMYVLLRQVIGFGASSLVGGCVDFGLAWILLDFFRERLAHNHFLRISLAIFIARICSLTINYLLNRFLIFKKQRETENSFKKYISLAIVLLGLSIGSVYIGSTYLGIDEKMMKLLADLCLFGLSYTMQKHWVFGSKESNPLYNSIFRRNLFLGTAFILTTTYLVWRTFFTLPIEESFMEFVFGVMLLSAEIITCLTTFELYYRKVRSTNKELPFPNVDSNVYPHVDVFIATHNEEVDLLYKTANACTFMDYPDKQKVHIYFCDDGNRPEVAKLAADLGIHYIGLKENKDAKSGNLNHALAHTDSPLIATFDADMIPQRSFLMKTVPYFFLDTYIEEEGVWRQRTEEELEKAPKIGLIQTPQSFYNPDLFQFNLYSENNIPNEQDFFSKEVNIMRNSSNAVAYTGSNTVISRQAMQDIGGFPLHTITEDFETSVRIQKEKYITYATSEVQAAGLTTTTFKSMIKQRKRWAQGVIQSLQNTNAIFTTKLPLATNISYLCGYLYWWSFLNRLVFILAPIMFALFDFQIMEATFKELLILWLPSYFFYSTSFRYLSSNIRTNRWSQTIDIILAPYMIGCVLLESIGIHERKFKVTNKNKEEKSDLKYALPHIMLILLTVMAFIRFFKGKYGWALLYSSIILLWLLYNLISLSYAVLFMCGRKAYRKNERIKVSESVVLTVGDKRYTGMTIDLSDGGMLLQMSQSVYIPKTEEVGILLRSADYTAYLKGKIVYVKKVGEAWYYALETEPCTEGDKRQYFQIIYDRPHTLPTTINIWSTIYDDFYRNIQNRVVKSEQHRRQLTRVSIERNVELKGGIKGYIHDWNYEYMTLSGGAEVLEERLYELPITEVLTLVLVPIEMSVKYANARLYQVLNKEELLESGFNIEMWLANLDKEQEVDKELEERWSA